MCLQYDVLLKGIENRALLTHALEIGSEVRKFLLMTIIFVISNGKYIFLTDELKKNDKYIR